jgi:hypothetical protein
MTAMEVQMSRPVLYTQKWQYSSRTQHSPIMGGMRCNARNYDRPKLMHHVNAMIYPCSILAGSGSTDQYLQQPHAHGGFAVLAKSPPWAYPINEIATQVFPHL